LILFPDAKINLGLHIIRKRPDNFHDLETVFYPIPLQEAVEVIQAKAPAAKDVTFSTSGLDIDVDPTNNICVKAYNLLKQDYPQLPPVLMHLHKVIPSGAGLGGGSADGAFTLMLLNKKFELNISKEKLLNYALQLGSDCPFFIINKAAYGTGRGEQLEEIPLDLGSYKIMIVHPGIHVNTGWAFSQITPGVLKHSLKEIIRLPVAEWKGLVRNDFEECVFKHYPEIQAIKEQLYMAGAVYASMSGSGSTVYGIFEKEPVLKALPAHYFVKILQ
jgi:4-diphosphocytidyl-2-C-methyl-D-erythritol kinase